MDNINQIKNISLSNLLFVNTSKDTVTMQPSLQQITDTSEAETALHKTAVLIIMGILIFISVSISGAVLVFCKKKNSVFNYQKSEQEDNNYEYEMDDINNEMDSSENGSVDNEPIRSQTYPMMAANNVIKTCYKFIPKSNTFSGIDNLKISDLETTELQHSSRINQSYSFCTSSSPSLNFESLTIQVDVEPCLEKRSSECLNNFSIWNENANICHNEHVISFKSQSADHLKNDIPWDNDSNSTELHGEIKSDSLVQIKQCLDNQRSYRQSSSTENSKNCFLVEKLVPTNDNNFHLKKCSNNPTENDHSRNLWAVATKCAMNSDDEENEIHRPLLPRPDIV